MVEVVNDGLPKVEGEAQDILLCLARARKLLRYAQNEGNTPIFLTQSMRLVEQIDRIEGLPCID